MANQKVLSRNFINKRTFEYHKGNSNLSFTLEMDVKTNIKDFNDLLKEASVDLEKEIKEFKSA